MEQSEHVTPLSVILVKHVAKRSPNHQLSDVF